MKYYLRLSSSYQMRKNPKKDFFYSLICMSSLLSTCCLTSDLKFNIFFSHFHFSFTIFNFLFYFIFLFVKDKDLCETLTCCSAFRLFLLYIWLFLTVCVCLCVSIFKSVTGVEWHWISFPFHFFISTFSSDYNDVSAIIHCRSCINYPDSDAIQF